jgi:hypothetical protein
VAGVERSAYRIQGNACPGTQLLPGISNNYMNNEAHSAMSGVSLWPSDSGFLLDRGMICRFLLNLNFSLSLSFVACVLIQGFK